MMDKAILTCALTGVLTNPRQYPVPVTPAQMTAEARDAFNAGASIMHVHLRMQEEGMGTCRAGILMWPKRWSMRFVRPVLASSSI